MVPGAPFLIHGLTNTAPGVAAIQRDSNLRINLDRRAGERVAVQY